jgi:inosine-uridine nucleoside N-ribohydrolase
MRSIILNARILSGRIFLADRQDYLWESIRVKRKTRDIMTDTIYHFVVPEAKKIRLIINTDAKNEADDQYAIVHALLTPKFVIKGIIGAHFGTRRTMQSMLESYAEIEKVLQLTGYAGVVPAFKGAENELENENFPRVSEGADLIIREALSNDNRPLFAIFLGPLTDLASAILMEPKITGRLTAIWIGGGAWPDGGEEFNLSNDIHAANVVFSSGIALWQVPRDVYLMMRVCLSELQTRVEPCGEVGRYMFRQLVDFNTAMGDNLVWPAGESWCLGDSPAVGLLLDQHEYCFDLRPAPRVGSGMRYEHIPENHLIRVYNRIDPRFILEDFYSKLRLNFS